MRVEANMSIAEPGAKLGTKVEVKNLNSFRAVRDAINYEVERQTKIIEGGGKVIQETRGWDERGVTVSQRLKEQAHDYRYMPEPDLPPLLISEDEIAELKANLTELPEAKRNRFAQEYGLSPEQASLVTDDLLLSEYFEEAASELAAEKLGKEPEIYQLLANYVLTDLKGLMQKNQIDISGISEKLTAANFAHLISLISLDKISSRTAKDMLVKMAETGSDPHDILKDSDLGQIHDESQLMKIVDKVIESTPKAVSDYKQGKVTAVEALVGRAMGELKGRGNPEVLRKLFADRLSK
jgi:aspartyl-tRNA(Asn)/glutamyl-tRNA(Gln) amidotransferase subunit B